MKTDHLKTKIYSSSKLCLHKTVLFQAAECPSSIILYYVIYKTRSLEFTEFITETSSNDKATP
jgi:hypothetical protein